VFDLDGNAAEWATQPDGAGVIVGPCASMPGDPRQIEIQPDPELVGFRVVLEPTEQSAKKQQGTKATKRR